MESFFLCENDNCALEKKPCFTQYNHPKLRQGPLKVTIMRTLIRAIAKYLAPTDTANIVANEEIFKSFRLDHDKGPSVNYAQPIFPNSEIEKR
jgi:hypothetical protein